MKIQLPAPRRAAIKLPPIPAALTQQAMGAMISVKDRDAFERQIVNLQTKAAPGTDIAWRRLTATMMALAGNLVKITGMQSVLFYTPDGRHRKQVFALQLTDTFQIVAYMPNVLEDALAAKLIGPLRMPAPDQYRIAPGDDKITIEPLDGDTLNPQPQFKGLTGWNRKAIAVVLPVDIVEAQLVLTEQLAAIAAMAWPAPTPFVPGSPIR